MKKYLVTYRDVQGIVRKHVLQSPRTLYRWNISPFGAFGATFLHIGRIV